MPAQVVLIGWLITILNTVIEVHNVHNQKNMTYILSQVLVVAMSVLALIALKFLVTCLCTCS